MSRKAVGLLALLLAGAPPAGGQPWMGDRLCAPQLPRGAEFGSAVAVGADGTIAVGDFRHDVVYLIVANETGCSVERTLSGEPGSWWGFSLAISGGKLLVGAPKAGGTGAAYLIDLSDPELRRTALAPTPARSGDEIGSAVAIDGNNLAIGARGADERRGRVYFSSGGSLVVVPVDGLAPRAELGRSVALHGSLLVMGAPHPYRGSGSPGEAWIYNLTRQELSRLSPGGLEPEAAFGFAVAVAGDRILAGAPLADRAGRDAGAVYGFALDGSEGTPLALPGREGDQLGVAVAAEGGTAVIGARYAGGARGAAYLWRESGVQTLQPAVTVPGGAQLGYSVAIRGDVAVAGAFRENGTGAAYLFHPEPAVELAGLELSPAPLTTSEDGTPVAMTVRLTGPPTAPVKISFEAVPPLAELSPSEWIFTGGEPGIVRVKGLDNTDCGPLPAPRFTIRATAASADPAYDGLVRILDAENTDDDRACLAVTARTVCTDGNGTVVYTISLANTAPGAPEASAVLRGTLPPGVSVITAAADRGTATTDTLANSVRWSGPVAAAGGGEATITLVAALDDPPGSVLSLRPLVTYDRDARGPAETLPVVFAAADVIPCPP